MAAVCTLVCPVSAHQPGHCLPHRSVSGEAQHKLTLALPADQEYSSPSVWKQHPNEAMWQGPEVRNQEVWQEPGVRNQEVWQGPGVRNQEVWQEPGVGGHTEKNKGGMGGWSMEEPEEVYGTRHEHEPAQVSGWPGRQRQRILKEMRRSSGATPRLSRNFEEDPRIRAYSQMWAEIPQTRYFLSFSS